MQTAPTAQAAGAGTPREESKAESAAAADGAAHAQFLEELGKTEEAAREYEAAFAKSRAPELLYRLALCRRALGDYAAAREALRGYLRESPDGPLRDEVERQLAQLAVLIEARGLLNQKPAKSRKRERAPSAPASNRPAASAPASSAVLPIDAQPASETSATHDSSASAQTSAPTARTAAPTPAPAPNGPAPKTPAAESEPVQAAGRDEPIAGTQQGSAPGIVSNEHEASRPAPAAALRIEPPAQDGLRARWKSSAPWLAGSAVVLAGAGIGLCVNAHQIAQDLDTRFTQGSLTRADLPRYSRVSAEGASGTALLVAAALAGATALVLAW